MYTENKTIVLLSQKLDYVYIAEFTFLSNKLWVFRKEKMWFQRFSNFFDLIFNVFKISRRKL